jgi:hypothetical protein
LPHLSIANISRSYELNVDTSTTYVFLMVDADYNKTTPTNVNLHTLYANLTAEGSTSSEVAKYLAPQPQLVGATHNFTLLLFRQPESDFTIPAEYASYVATNSHTPYNRINLPLPQFLKDTGLGKPLAANWFREKASNSSSSSKSATKTPSCSTASTSVTPSATASPTRRRQQSILVWLYLYMKRERPVFSRDWGVLLQ